MFGDYFQHDAHELLCCVLSHIDDAVTRLRQFCNSAVSALSNCRPQSPALTNCRLRSPASCHSFSQGPSVSLVTTPPSRTLRSKCCHSLSCTGECSRDASVTTPPSRLQRGSSAVSAVTNCRLQSPALTNCRLRSPASRHGFSQDTSASLVTTPPSRTLRSKSVHSAVTDEQEAVTTPPSKLLRSRSLQSCQALSPAMTDKRVAVTTPSLRLLRSRSVQSTVANERDRIIPESVNYHRRSLPVPCSSPVVDLCMPLKCSSLGHLSSDSSREAVTTPPSRVLGSRSVKLRQALSPAVTDKREAVTTPPLSFLHSKSVQSAVANDREAVTMSPLRVLWSRSVKLRQALSPAMTYKREAESAPSPRLLRSTVANGREAVAMPSSRLRSRSVQSTVANDRDRIIPESVNYHRHSLPVPWSSPVVDLCMPLKRSSLGHVSSDSSHQRLSTTVTVTPDLQCERLRRKRKSSLTSRPMEFSHDVASSPRLRSLFDDNFSDNCGQCTSIVTVSPDVWCKGLRRKRKSSLISRPTKCSHVASSSDLADSSRQQISCTVTVSPDMLCERFGRKRKSSRSRSLPSQPAKYRNVASSFRFGGLVDSSTKNCGPSRTSRCLREASFEDYGQMRMTSSEFLLCTSGGSYDNNNNNDDDDGDCFQGDRVVTQLTDAMKSPGCSTPTTDSVVPVADDQCPRPVLPHTTDNCFREGHVVTRLTDDMKLAGSTPATDGVVRVADGGPRAVVPHTTDNCFQEGHVVTWLTDDMKSPGRSTPATDGVVPVADGGPRAVLPHTNVREKLLLSLKAIESGRSCNISLCSDDMNSVSAEAASRHCRHTLNNNVKAPRVKHGAERRRHVACVQDLFAGQLLTQTKCLSCGSVAKHSERYEDVAVFTGHCLRDSTCHTLL